MDATPDAAPRDDVDQRARWLVAGLVADHLAPDVDHAEHAIAVLCCDEHADDGEVACRAVASLGVPLAVVPTDQWAPAALRAALQLCGARLALACSHGTSAWRASGAAGRIVGDGPGVRWWRLVELDGRLASRAASGLRTAGC